MKKRRTKIIATICEAGSSVEQIRSFIKSGMDIIRINMAYCSQKVNKDINLYINFADLGNCYEK